MPKPVTLEMLKRMSVDARRTIYKNASLTNSPEADEIIELLFQHKLIDQIGGGLPRSHGTVQQIEAVCRSDQGVAAAVQAATESHAPMAGVDPILFREVREYGYFDTTSWAGTFVADEMEARGWVRQGRKNLPEGLVAKTAAFFVSQNAGAE